MTIANARHFGDPLPAASRARVIAAQARGRRGTKHPNSRKTECPHGHPYSRGNTYRTAHGFRVCRTCNAARWRRAHLRKRRGWGACVGCRREDLRTRGDRIVPHGLTYSPRRCPGSGLPARKEA